jgi:hypothetical protein
MKFFLNIVTGKTRLIIILNTLHWILGIILFCPYSVLSMTAAINPRYVYVRPLSQWQGCDWVRQTQPFQHMKMTDCLLGCCAVSSHSNWPTCQRYLLPPSTGQWASHARESMLRYRSRPNTAEALYDHGLRGVGEDWNEDWLSKGTDEPGQREGGGNREREIEPWKWTGKYNMWNEDSKVKVKLKLRKWHGRKIQNKWRYINVKLNERMDTGGTRKQVRHARKGRRSPYRGSKWKEGNL